MWKFSAYYFGIVPASFACLSCQIILFLWNMSTLWVPLYFSISLCHLWDHKLQFLVFCFDLTLLGKLERGVHSRVPRMWMGEQSTSMEVVGYSTTKHTSLTYLLRKCVQQWTGNIQWRLMCAWGSVHRQQQKTSKKAQLRGDSQAWELVCVLSSSQTIEFLRLTGLPTRIMGGCVG